MTKKVFAPGTPEWDDYLFNDQPDTTPKQHKQWGEACVRWVKKQKEIEPLGKAISERGWVDDGGEKRPDPVGLWAAICNQIKEVATSGQEDKHTVLKQLGPLVRDMYDFAGDYPDGESLLVVIGEILPHIFATKPGEEEYDFLFTFASEVDLGPIDPSQILGYPNLDKGPVHDFFLEKIMVAMGFVEAGFDPEDSWAFVEFCDRVKAFYALVWDFDCFFKPESYGAKTKVPQEQKDLLHNGLTKLCGVVPQAISLYEKRKDWDEEQEEEFLGAVTSFIDPNMLFEELWDETIASLAGKSGFQIPAEVLALCQKVAGDRILDKTRAEEDRSRRSGGGTPAPPISMWDI